MFLSIVVAVFLLSAGSAFKIQPKIFNGFPAQDPTQFPYYVFLEMSMQKGTFSCGGTIISDEWVVTAAHCLDLDFSHVYVHFVAWKLGERHPALKVDENGIFIHPEWDADIVQSDIALIRLPRQIKLSPAVQPIKFSQNCYTNEVDLNVYAVGNGARSMNTEGLPEVLQYAPLQTISWQLCRRYFSPMKFPRNVVCAASRARRSVCKGDSGGPLVRSIDKTFVGIASFIHLEGWSQGYPQVFTAVVPFYRWISSVTGLKLPKC